MSLRIFCTIFLVVSVVAFPLFFTIAVGLFSVIWFRGYYELIPIYFLGDAVYGIPLSHFFSFSYVMTLLACVLVGLSVFIRKQMVDTKLGHI